jgi:two-component system, NtrC family, sensor histidine kinase PilS
MAETSEAADWSELAGAGLSHRSSVSATPSEFVRLWRGFMTARVTLGLVLLLLQIALTAIGQSSATLLLVLSGIYLMAALIGRLVLPTRHLGSRFGMRWALVVGVDLAAFSGMQMLQGSSINYAPLMALPVLLAAVLGSLFLAMGTAAAASLLLLAYAAWAATVGHADPASQFAQSALMGAGCFVMAFLSSQVSTRLAVEERRAHQNQLAVLVQQQVNELVIESMGDGILVVDAHGQVRAVNPAARRMLGAERTLPHLKDQAAWSGLADLAALRFAHSDLRRKDVTIHHPGQGIRRLQVRAQLTGGKINAAENLCVMFLQDQRELEARMRTEKLASMGRMSAAVAHEIRNPLAAISQANDLLEEEVEDPKQLQLIRMIAQNAVRLGKIVDEVLNIGRVQSRTDMRAGVSLDLNATVARIGADWNQQTGSQAVVQITLAASMAQIEFDVDHLRRVMVNLLDNARRYTPNRLGAIQVRTRMGPTDHPTLDIWSDSAPIEPTVERHLFEPFFSSESRSSGLGLYICRELCEGHGATISYQRGAVQSVDGPVSLEEGNLFTVIFRRIRSNAPAAAQSGEMAL